MSQENVALHRRAIEAYNAGDVESFIAMSDPSIEAYSVFAAVGGGAYHGHDGLRRFFVDAGDTWEEPRGEVEAFFDLGDTTLVFYVLHGRGRQSGAEVAMPLAQVVTWRDGLVTYFKVYAHREDALSEVGISEDALERIAP